MEAVRHIEVRSQSLAHYLRPDLIPRTLWQHRQLIGQLTRRQIAARYRGSVLGVLWSFLLPLIMLVVYTFFFSVVFGSRWRDDSPPAASAPTSQAAQLQPATALVSAPAKPETKMEFALTLFCGLLLYNLFAEALNGSTSAVIANANYVKKVVFPLEILPVVHVATALVNALISFAILLVGIAAFQQRFPWLVGYWPLTLMPLLLLTTGLGWFVASISVYLRDAGHVVSVALQMLIFLTPVFYSIERLKKAPVLQSIMRLNPLSTIVESARAVVIYDRTPEWLWLGAVTLVGLAALQLGYAWFMKTRRGFADVL
jgi:lipopolysaccharide transport system permease protein